MAGLSAIHDITLDEQIVAIHMISSLPLPSNISIPWLQANTVKDKSSSAFCQNFLELWPIAILTTIFDRLLIHPDDTSNPI